MRRRKLKPRTPPIYDSRIHGHEFYEMPNPGEIEAECEARSRIWTAIGNAPASMKEDYLRACNSVAATAVNRTEKTLAIIHYHGEQSYSVDGATPVSVSGEEHQLLNAFMKEGRSFTKRELENTPHTISNVPQTVKRLTDRYGGMFKPAIRRPGKKGRGGYLARVLPVKELD